MSPTRTFNVLTLTLILFLAGCFGIGDSAEAADDHDHTPNAAPVLHAEILVEDVEDLDYILADCTTDNCNITAYHAVVDPNGDQMDAGYDFNLDGEIDYQVIEHRGITDLQIPITEFFETVLYVDTVVEESNCVNEQKLVVTNTSTITNMFTTFAFISKDSNDAASAVLLNTEEMIMLTTDTEMVTESCIVPVWTWDDSDSTNGTNGTFSQYYPHNNHIGDKLIDVEMLSGDELNFSDIKIEIMIDGGAGYTCKEYFVYYEYCVFQDYNSNGMWDTNEVITIAEGYYNLCSDTCEVQVVITLKEDERVIGDFSSWAVSN